MYLIQKLLLIPKKLKKLKQLLNEGNDIKLFQEEWALINQHNLTIPYNIFPKEIVKVGNKTYGPLNILFWGDTKEKLIIGNYVSIAPDVKFVLGGNHYYNGLATYPFKVKLGFVLNEAYSNGPIIVEDDVWIGLQSIIMSGVTIGRGSIIAAGSVVTKSIPEFSIVGGNPAKFIKNRFSKDIIIELKDLNYTIINEDVLKQNINLLYQELTPEVLVKLKLFLNKI